MNKIKYTLFLILFIINSALLSQVNWNNNSVYTTGHASSLGQNNASNGWASFSSGSNSSATGDFSTAIGIYAISIGDDGFAFGGKVKNAAGGSFTIGRGYLPSGLYLTNGIQNTMMIGFNSTAPTLFISESESDAQNTDRTGKIGIGNMTNPQAKLHIYADENENASLFLQPSNWGTYLPTLAFGNSLNLITADATFGMIYRTGRFHSFMEGNVGIGIEEPEFTLDVRGDVNFSGNLLHNGTVVSSPWTQLENSIYYLGDNVGIGTSKPLSRLEIVGPVSIGYNVVPPAENTLIVEGKIGIGTFAPEVDLDVKGKIKTSEFQLVNGNLNGNILQCDNDGNATWVDPSLINDGDWTLLANNLYVDESRNVGIGTSTPVFPLEVIGDTKISGSIYGAHNDWQSLKLYGGTNTADGAYMTLASNYNETASIKLFARGTSGRIEFHNYERQVMSVRADGNIYLGSPENESNIYVNGEVNAYLVRVKNDLGWWDKVFDEEYELMSLYDLEQFIKQNKHLPDIPTNSEVKEDGIELAEMNALLLKKIEELTLYILNQEKRIRDLEEITK